KYMIDKLHIHLFVEWGYLGMFNPRARVDSAMYVLEKGGFSDDSIFIKLNNLYETKRYDALFEAYNAELENGQNKNLYHLPQTKLKLIKTWPFIYWISDGFREKFLEDDFDSAAKVVSGIKTGDNDRLLRYFWEVDGQDISQEY